jgi:quercetin dioxygenase-like cupin family protein
MVVEEVVRSIRDALVLMGGGATVVPQVLVMSWSTMPTVDRQFVDGRVLVTSIAAGAAPGKGLRRVLNDSRGEFALFLRGACAESAEYVEFTAGTTRGNHVHSLMTERVYVARGRVQLTVASVDGDQHGSPSTIELLSGDLVEIAPNIAHAFFASEASTIVSLGFGADPFDDRRPVALLP